MTVDRDKRKETSAVALADKDMLAAIAVTRFGLGAKPGEIAEAARDPHGFLRAQIRRSGADQPPGQPVTSRERMGEFRDYQRERREARLEKTADVRPAAAAPANGADPTMADARPKRRDVADPVKAVGNMLREDISSDFTARTQLAASTDAAFRERWTLFWANHFTVSATKAITGTVVGPFEQEAIRPNVFGHFEDLLGAAESHPAMLTYLDQIQSIGPDSQFASMQRRGGPFGVGARPQQAALRSPGLNENLAREIMELHTVGVNGGYTQADVTQVARVFTGWTFQSPQQAPGQYQRVGFMFDPKKHEPGPKEVLGHTIKDAGMDEGMQVLEMLSRSPATAKFVCTKLARRFVSDDPPPALVKQMSETFLSSDGDIRAVLRTMFHSKEFWSTAVYRKKVKTPLEFVASALRATGTDVQNPGAAVQALAKMGMPLYQMAPPTGYSTAADVWMNSDALLDRLNFSLALTSGGQNGLKFDPLRVLTLGLLTRAPKEEIVPVNTSGGSEAAVALIEDALIGGETSKTTNEAIHKEMNDPQIAAHLSDDPGKALGTIIGLALGSPEFQLR